MKTSNNILRPARLQFLSMQRVWARLFLGILTAMSLGYGVADAQSNDLAMPGMPGMPGMPAKGAQTSTKEESAQLSPEINKIVDALTKKPSVLGELRPGGCRPDQECGNSNNPKELRPCGICAPGSECTSRKTCERRTGGENCSYSAWSSACFNWHSLVLTSSACAAGILACYNFTGGPTAGPLCWQLTLFTACAIDAAYISIAMESLDNCVNYSLRCDSGASDQAPSFCDPRGKSFPDLMGIYCDRCCVMAYPYDSKGGDLPGDNDKKRPGCRDTCLKLGLDPKPPVEPPVQNPGGPGTCHPGDPSNRQGAGNFCMPPYKPQVMGDRCRCVK